MSDTQESLRDDAWLEGPLTLGEYTLRPFTLGTLLLATKFDLSAVWSGGVVAGLDKASLDGQVATYIWMQSSPIAEVLEAARDGTWRAVEQIRFSESLTLAAVILTEIRRHKDLIEAAKFRVSGGQSSTGQFPANWLARKLHLLTLNRGWSTEYVLWELPFSQAEQIEHCIMRGLGWATYKPEAMEEVKDKVAKVEEAARKAAALDEGW